jgi:hypothetical protein
MTKQLLATILGIGLTALVARGQLAITETMSSASTNLGPATVVQGPDFWELTNFGTNSMDLSGYIFNDSDATRGGDADSTTLSGVTIGPGESIILVQSGTTVVTTRDDFINWWGAANLPTNLQVLFYSGNGQSSSGDSIVLWAPSAASDADYVDRADYGEAARGHSFTYNPSNGVYGIISANGVNGAFKAATSDDEGSPGRTTGAVTLKILQQPTPASLSIPAGQDVTFNAVAQGLPHSHYQWRFNGVSIDGAISPALTVTNAQVTNSGQYSVMVTNGLKALLSSNAVLTVTTSPVAPTFLTGPKNADAFFGQTVLFAAQASGSPTPSLQWYKDGVELSGVTSPQLTLTDVQGSDAGLYSLIASNSVGTNLASATLTVGPKPRLLITEVQPSGSGESGHADWWELTSFDSRAFNLKGWRWDDSSHSLAPGNAYVFTNDIFIHPGETMIFVENISASGFRAWWGPNLPAGLQINTYIGGGLGLSQTADEVNLWNAVTLVGNELTERICGVNFAASFTNSTLVYDPENPPVAGVFSVFSTNTIAGAAANGIFQAAQLFSMGSPGYVIAPIRITSSLTEDGKIALSWNSAANRNYTVEYKTDIVATNWLTLTNLTATGPSATVTDPAGATSRFYRVGAVIPFVSEP